MAEATGSGVEVGAALEAMAGIGVEAVAARGAADGHGLEPCGFDEDVFGVGVIMVSQPPMTPARPRAFSWSAMTRSSGSRMRSMPSRVFELFAFAGAADDDAAFDLVEVEGVGGLAHREPCEVGGVDGVGDLFLLEEAEVGGDFGAGDTSRAMSADGDVAKDAGGEAAAGVLGFDRDGEWHCGGLRPGSVGVERLEWKP